MSGEWRGGGGKRKTPPDRVGLGWFLSELRDFQKYRSLVGIDFFVGSQISSER